MFMDAFFKTYVEQVPAGCAEGTIHVHHRMHAVDELLARKGR